jgi:hypothetical protein
MKNLWQLFGGIMIALTSIRLILGSLSLSLTEENITTKLAITIILIIPPFLLNAILPSDTLNQSFGFAKEF